jgi:hypothetical protein
MSDQFPSVPQSGEIRIRQGKQELVAAGEMLSIGGKEFDLSRVDRVTFRVATRLNQASYLIGVAQGDKKCRFMFDAYKRLTELDETYQLWLGVVDLLERTACQRIADSAGDAISAGGTATFGGAPAARIDADAEGLRPHRPFGKKVPWSQVAEARMVRGQVEVLTEDELAAGRRPKLSIDMSGWNAVVLPRVVAQLAGR